MQFRPSKRQPRKHRPKPLAKPDNVQPINEPAPCRELIRLTLYNPRTGTHCVIVPYPGSRPGRLRVMVNGKHQPAIATTTELMDWLRRKMPRTTAKRKTEE